MFKIDEATHLLEAKEVYSVRALFLETSRKPFFDVFSFFIKGKKMFPFFFLTIFGSLELVFLYFGYCKVTNQRKKALKKPCMVVIWIEIVIVLEHTYSVLECLLMIKLINSYL